MVCTSVRHRCGLDKVYLWSDAASDTYLILLVQLTGAVWRETKTCPTGTTIPVHRRLQWHLSYKWIFIISRFAYYRGSIAYVVEFICRFCNSVTDVISSSMRTFVNGAKGYFYSICVIAVAVTGDGFDVHDIGSGIVPTAFNFMVLINFWV